MEKHYIVDIGTNSVRLMCAQWNGFRVTSLGKPLRITRLGDKVDRNGELNAQAIDRTMRGIKELLGEMGIDPSATPVYAYATSAVRDASNKTVIEDSLKKLHIPLEVLSGEQEAELAYLGAIGDTREISGLIDIGGGSTELVVGREGRILHRGSAQLGTVRAMERFAYGDPVNLEQVERLLCWAQSAIADEMKSMYGINCGWTGVGGTMTTLAAIKGALEPYDPKAVADIVLLREDVEAMMERLCALTKAQRAELPGLQPQRADVIVAGCAIVLACMRELRLEQVSISDQDGMEGYLLARLR